MLRAQTARQSYAAIDVSTRTEQASPHRLIELLYDELLACLRQAAIAASNGDLSLRSSRISKALTILSGLQGSLDFARGGEVASTLGSVYDFVRQEAIAGGSANDPARLAAAADAIGELADAWRQIRP